MKLLLSLVLCFPGASHAATYTVTQVQLVDCQGSGGCGPKIDSGDTEIFTGLSGAGTTVFNGITKTGTTYGTVNDANIHWEDLNQHGPNCFGRSIVWLTIRSIDATSALSQGRGAINAVNCMTSFAADSNDPNWDPAAPGTCATGYVDSCDWKSMGVICVDGVCYLQVFRQVRSSGAHIYRGHDSTLIKTSNGGATWLNPAHVGGTPNANGDAPAGPGDASYAASILWPDPSSHNGTDQKMARLEFVQYGRDGAWPSVDNNSTYVYAISYSGSFNSYFLARVLRANMANLSASDWSYYKCPGYATAVCDGMNSANWSSTMSDATAIPGAWSIGGVIYDNNLHIYISSGAGGGAGFVPIQTAPKPWGPWTESGHMPEPLPNPGFVSPIPASLTAISATKSQVTFAFSTSKYVSGGTPAYVTYEITDTTQVRGLFPLPSPVKR